MNKLLIVSYHFPPAPGVGGRRWAKFVKYLSKNNDTAISVVSAKSTLKKNITSSYNKDVAQAKFNHLELNPNYPFHLQNMEFPTKGIVASVMFRLQRLFVMLTSKGNYFDYTIFWKKYFIKEIPDLIRQNEIETVIISGPPFRYVMFALDLKKQFENIQIIYDARDPWCDPNHPPTISKKRHQFEIEAEKFVFEKVDKILAVSEFQKSIMETRVPKHAPIFVLRNGFDPDDIPELLGKKIENGSQIKIAHFGVMHANKDYYWKPLVHALNILKTQNRNLFDKLSFEFIGLCPDEVKTGFESTGVNLVLHGYKKMDEAYNILNHADFVLWFKYDGAPGDYATKFYDYISLRKYMWTFSVRGEVTDYINQNKIGTVFYRDDSNLVNTLVSELKKLENKDNFVFNPEYQSNDLSIQTLSNKLIEIIAK